MEDKDGCCVYQCTRDNAGIQYGDRVSDGWRVGAGQPVERRRCVYDFSKDGIES